MGKIKASLIEVDQLIDNLEHTQSFNNIVDLIYARFPAYAQLIGDVEKYVREYLEYNDSGSRQLLNE